MPQDAIDLVDGDRADAAGFDLGGMEVGDPAANQLHVFHGPRDQGAVLRCEDQVPGRHVAAEHNEGREQKTDHGMAPG